MSKRIAERAALPEEFLARMAVLLGDEYEEFRAALMQPPSVGLRVNTLKVSPEAFRALSPFELAPVDWCAEGFVWQVTVTSEVTVTCVTCQPGKHPHHAAGLYYLQEPSAMAAATLLAPRPGERVLDLCAAPGGKATHIAALMQGEGLLVANDIRARRARVLAQNLERCGVRNCIVLNESPARLAERFPGFFDRILVDAPCSGEGMFRKSEEARRAWSPKHVRGCTRRQGEIMASAARMLRPGGLLAYVTCTFAPEENERVIARFLRNHPDFTVEAAERYLGFAPGRPDWLEGPERAVGQALAKAVRLWPHRLVGEGGFIALLRREGDTAVPAPLVRPRRELPARARQAFEAFCQEHLIGMSAAEFRLVASGQQLYALPSDAPNLNGLRVVRPGWWLGSFRGNRFRPSQALAMGLTCETVRQALDLPSEGEEVFAYLRGEPLAAAGDDGWVLIAVDGYPLGWGWRVRGVVKSRYPRAWRNMAGASI